MLKISKIRNIGHYFNEREPEFLEKKPAAQTQPKGTIIEVPFAEKDRAKSLGAKWNSEIKKWYIPEGIEKEKFSEWMEDFRVLNPPIYLASSSTNCWKCSQKTPVFCLAYRASKKSDGYVTFVSFLGYVPNDLHHIFKEKAPTYYLAYTKQSDSSYYVNHCKCGAKLGDFFLHEEPDGPFCIMSKEELNQITLSDLNIKNAIEIK